MSDSKSSGTVPAHLFRYMVLVAVVIGGIGTWGAYTTQATHHDLYLTETTDTERSSVPSSAVTQLESLDSDMQQRLHSAMTETVEWRSAFSSLTYQQLEYVEADGTLYQVTYHADRGPFIGWFLGVWAVVSTIILGSGLIAMHHLGYNSLPDTRLGASLSALDF